MKQREFLLIAVSIFAVLASSALSFAQLYSEDFDLDHTANWTLNGGPSDEVADYFFDYNTVGIPSAPNSTGGSTRGLKMQANQTSAIFGGMSTSPIGQSFSGDYTLKFDWWANFNGPLGVGGSGSTHLSTFGIGTNGTTVQWPGGTQNSVWFGGTGDGQSSVDWRAYSNVAATGYLPASGVFAAGTGTSPDSRNNLHPYYAGFGGNAATTAQLTAYPQQTGSTAVGSAGMEWHQVEIKKLGNTATWTVSNTLIATIDLTTVTMAGGNIFLGHSDTNATISTDTNAGALLFTLIDNVKVEAIVATDADFNNNTFVDAADYVLWREYSGLGSGATNVQGDSDSDGDVDATDYANWRTAFGPGAGTGAFAAIGVPEPSALTLTIASLTLAIFRRRTR